MKMFKSAFLLLCLSLGLPWAGSAQEQPQARELMERSDRLYRADNSYARMRMTIVNPNWQRTMSMDIWSQGMKKTFIRILSPAKDKGTATLRIGNEMWNYFPKIDKVMKVPPSMMMSSWMGSDFTNDDLVKESTLIDDYDGKFAPPPDADPRLYYIELTPKERTPTVWGRILLVLERDSLLPVFQWYYDEKGSKMREIVFRDVKELGGRRLPAVMELTPLGKPGNKTVIEYTQAEFDAGVPDSVFSLRNLQRR